MVFRLEDAVNGIMEKLEFVDYHLEHELVTLSERVAGIQTKIEKLETLWQNPKSLNSVQNLLII